MTREAFDQLVTRIEARYAGKPGRLRLAVVFLALLSYASLLAWPVVAFAVAAAFISFGAASVDAPTGIVFEVIGVGVAIMGLVSLVSILRVETTPPDGVELRRGDAPALFAMLDELQRRLDASPVYRVTLASDCNAGVEAAPRLGFFGWVRHHLVLGLPLLEILSVEQLHSVLAHEFAHISARHGRVSGWIYRLRRYWLQAFERAGNRASGRRRFLFHPLLLKFFGWFWPRFNAHAFVLSRANEYEADATAAQLGGADHAASALLVSRLYGQLLAENFWPALWRRAADEAEPPADVFDQLRIALYSGLPTAQAEQWLREAFQVFTSHDDTHPCLTDRLRALGDTRYAGGKADRIPRLAVPSAASVLFGANGERLRAELGRAWQAEAAGPWQVSRARSHLYQAQVETLARVAPEAPGQVEVLWDQARALAGLHGDARAEPLLRQVLALRPTHPLANLQLGRHLLASGDAAGEPFLARAIAADEDLVPAVGHILSEHFTRNGDVARLRETRALLDRHDARLAASQAERNTVTAKDHFIAHELTPAQLAPVIETLRGEPELESAFLVRKELRHFPEQRLFVLVIHLASRWFGPANGSKSAVAISRLVRQVRLPGRMLVVADSGAFAAVARQAKRVPGAKFYDARVTAASVSSAEGSDAGIRV